MQAVNRVHTSLMTAIAATSQYDPMTAPASLAMLVMRLVLLEPTVPSLSLLLLPPKLPFTNSNTAHNSLKYKRTAALPYDPMRPLASLPMLPMRLVLLGLTAPSLQPRRLMSLRFSRFVTPQIVLSNDAARVADEPFR